jgi:DNA-binding transcriptional LysR family regulator
MLHVTFRQLRVFEAVARNLSYSRAAEELFLTQPAVSMQIKLLEESAGLPLFEQLGKKIFLTEAGREMFHYARAIAGQLAEAEAVLTELKGLQRGKLNISVVSTANYFAPQLLAVFCRRFDNITLSLNVANRETLLAQLKDNEMDMAIMGQPPDGQDIEAAPFMDNPLVVVASPSHPLARARDITPAQLASATFIVREPGSGTRGAMERYFQLHGMTLHTGMEMSTTEAIKQAVQAGMGLAVVSRHTIALELETRRLIILDVMDFPILRHWYVAHRKGKRLSAVAQAFKEFLLGEAAQLLETPGAAPFTGEAAPLKR